VPTEPLKMAVISRIAPRITTAPRCAHRIAHDRPCRRTVANGDAADAAAQRFINPVDVAILLSLTGRWGNRRLSLGDRDDPWTIASCSASGILAPAPSPKRKASERASCTRRLRI
jgi:hypothetical protein